MAPSKSQKHKWHISLGQEAWGYIPVHCDEWRRGANVNLSMGEGNVFLATFQSISPPKTHNAPVVILLFPFHIWGERMTQWHTEWKISFLVSISSSTSSYLSDLQTRYLSWSTALHVISLQNRSKKELPCRGTVNTPFIAFKAALDQFWTMMCIWK